MVNFTYKKHSSSWLIRWKWTPYSTDSISIKEIKKVAVDITQKSTFMCIDQLGYTLLLPVTESWILTGRSQLSYVTGIFVSTEQEAIDIIHILDKESAWKLLKK